MNFSIKTNARKIIQHEALVTAGARKRRALLVEVLPISGGCLNVATQERSEFRRTAVGRRASLVTFLSRTRKSLGRRDELPASAVKDWMVAIDQAATSAIGALKLRKRKALPSTNTLDSAMAPAAKIGDSRTPYAG